MGYTRAVANWQNGPAGGTPLDEAALDHIEDGIVAAADAADTANAGLAGKASTVHTHTSASITDIVEAVQDIVGAQLVAGTGATVAYNDTTGLITISATGGGSLDSEAVRDVVAAAMVAGTNIGIVYNDPADTITISTTATVNSSDASLRDRSTHTGTQLVSTIGDSGATGRAIVQAATQAAARAASGAGTSNLAVGPLVTDAKAGNWTPTIADLPAKVALVETTTTRPTARTDLKVIWTGADPSTSALDGDLWIRP